MLNTVGCAKTLRDAGDISERCPEQAWHRVEARRGRSKQVRFEKLGNEEVTVQDSLDRIEAEVKKFFKGTPTRSSGSTSPTPVFIAGRFPSPSKGADSTLNMR